MSSQCTNDGAYVLTVTFDLGTDLKIALVQVQNRVQLAMPQMPDAGAAAGRQYQEEDAQHPAGGEPLLARRPLRRALPVELRDAPHPRRADASARRQRRDVPRRAGLQHPRLARSGEAGRAEHDRRRRRLGHPRAEQSDGGGPTRPAAGGGAGRTSSRPSAPWGGSRRPNSSARSSSRPARRSTAPRAGPWSGSATWPGSSSAPSSTTSRACWTESRRSALAIFQTPTANMLDTADGVRRKMERAEAEFSRRTRLPHRLRHDARSSPSRSSKSSKRCATRSSWWPSWCWCSCRTGGRR